MIKVKGKRVKVKGMAFMVVVMSEYGDCDRSGITIGRCQKPQMSDTSQLWSRSLSEALLARYSSLDYLYHRYSKLITHFPF